MTKQFYRPSRFWELFWEHISEIADKFRDCFIDLWQPLTLDSFTDTWPLDCGFMTGFNADHQSYQLIIITSENALTTS